MNIGINNDYSGLYRATEQIKNDVAAKEPLVKCDDDVIAQFSEEALAALKASKEERGGTLLSAEVLAQQQADNAAKSERLQAEIKPAQKLHQFIPNIQTNDALVQSLKGLEANVVDSAYEIISDNLLKRNVGEMTEKERQALISLGMEKAKYLAENYMDKGQAEQFLGAMKTIAQYGVNGVKEENGKVRFDIKQGPMVGGADDMVNEFDIMRESDAEAYNTFNALMQEGKSAEAMKFTFDWVKNVRKSNPKIFAENATAFIDWKEKVSGSTISTAFSGMDTSSQENLMENLLQQNASNNFLDHTLLTQDLTHFFAGLMDT